MGVGARAAKKSAGKGGMRGDPRGGAKPLQPSYRRGKETQESIVAAAETVLVRYGHAGFTLKRVADCAGIAVGNLSYHFPTKDSLLELLIDQTLSEYVSRFAMLVPKHVETTAATLGKLVGWSMDDSITPRYTHLFRELWAASLHSPSLRVALERFYDQSIADLVNLIAPSSEPQKRQKLLTMVYMICILSEGSCVLFGTRARSVKLFGDLKAAAERMIASMAQAGE